MQLMTGNKIAVVPTGFLLGQNILRGIKYYKFAQRNCCIKYFRRGLYKNLELF